MNRKDFQSFATLLAAEVEIRSGKPLSEAAIGLWWDRMQRFDLTQVRAAFEAYGADAERGRWMPQPSDLIRYIEGTRTDRAAIAWGVVHGAMGTVGAYRDVEFGDPAVHAAIVDVGGWVKMCRTDLKELGHLQHRFCEAYRAYQDSPPANAPKWLMGDRSPDAEYERKGIPVPCAVSVYGAPARRRQRPTDAIANEVMAALK